VTSSREIPALTLMEDNLSRSACRVSLRLEGAGMFYSVTVRISIDFSNETTAELGMQALTARIGKRVDLTDDLINTPGEPTLSFGDLELTAGCPKQNALAVIQDLLEREKLAEASSA
jgi:hypothetical protein